jgi:Fur family ferric uptake transcriptional regulator
MDSKSLEITLNAKQINPTAMRLLVLDFLLQQNAAVSLTILEKEFEHSDRITLYRTLKTFEKKGLIHSVNDGHSTKYAICSDSCHENAHTDTHLHFYCTACQNTFCLPKISIPMVDIPHNFQLEELSVMARGICENCRS